MARISLAQPGNGIDKPSMELRRRSIEKSCNGKALFEQKSYGKAWHRRDSQWQKTKGDKMKALIEVALMWGVALAMVLAAFLLNLWLVHHIELLVGISGAWYIIIVAAVMATVWILSFGGDKNEKPES